MSEATYVFILTHQACDGNHLDGAFATQELAKARVDEALKEQEFDEDDPKGIAQIDRQGWQQCRGADSMWCDAWAQLEYLDGNPTDESYYIKRLEVQQ